MKSILILIIALVVLLGITSSGTVGSFGDSETAADNQLVLQWEQQCLHGLFNVVNDGSNTDSVFMYDETGALLTELTFTLDSENKKPSGALIEYKWLNGIVAAATGERRTDKVIITVYEVT